MFYVLFMFDDIFTTCLETGMSLKMTHRTMSAEWFGVNKTRLLGSLSLRLPEPVLISFFFM